MESRSPEQSEPAAQFGRLTPDQARRIDEICDYFEHQLYTQGRATIEELLGTAEEAERSVLLRELLFLEVEGYLVRDAIPNREQCLQRFPQHRMIVEEVFGTLCPAATSKPVTEDSWPQLPNYRILHKLGQGGMGCVYEAIHVKLGSRVALKILRPNLAGDMGAEVRFEREMRLIGGLSHSNIVAARDAGRWETQPYLVMDYVEGLDLGDILLRLGTLRVADACEIVRRVALALEHAHQHNLVHRDIKPKNILLGRCPPEADEVQVKVVDLGLAALRGYPQLRESGTGPIVGTFAFMAPEQYWEQKADICSDIYSLGCTLYCFLLGRSPFTRPRFCDVPQIMAAHRDAAIPPPRPLRPDVSEKLQHIIFTMMAKRPKDRFQRPREVAESVLEFTVGHDLPGLLRRAKSVPTMPSAAYIDTPAVPTIQETPSPSPRHAEPLSETSQYAPPPAQVNTADRNAAESVDASDPALPSDASLADSPHAAGHVARTRTMLILSGIAIVLAALVTIVVWNGLRLPASEDLLELVEPQRDALVGAWEFQGKILRSPDDPFARLILPVAAPEQYLLEVGTQRISGGRLVIGLVWQGQQIPVVLDSVSVTTGGPATEIGGKVPIPPAFRIPASSPNTYACIVRREGILVAYEGQPRLLCLAESPLPSFDPAWLTRDRSRLFLGTHHSVYGFTKVRLVPLAR